MLQTTWHIPAMRCSHCEQRVRRALEGIAGLEIVSLDGARQSLELRTAGVEPLAYARHRLAEIGYPMERC